MQFKQLALAAVLAVFALPAHAQADKSDHPLVSPYEGSIVRRKDVKEFDEYQAFTGMDDTGKEPMSIDLEGKVTKLLYTTPKDRSILEVFRNYEAAVLQAGAEIIYSCDQGKYECARSYAGPTFQKVSDIHSMQNLSGRYLLARLEQNESTAYIAIAVGAASTTVHVVEVKAMDTGMVTLDAEALGKGLDARGYVVVEGIYFDTDKATMQPRSAAALTEMAGLLEARPDLAVYVVGHTDSQGTFEHNQALSEARAKAVVEALVAEHGVPQGRLQAHGVGPLAPQASNADDNGRARNRRVVLVAR